MKYSIFASALIASAFTLAAAGKKGYSQSYSTKGRSSRKSTDCTSSTSSTSCSSSSSSSSSSSDSSSSSSSDDDCGPQFKVVRKYGRWCDYSKACHKHGMVPAKITSRNIYSAVRAIRKSQHKSAWIKSWNTDPYKGSLVLTAPNQKCDGPGSITVACKGVKKVALCMHKKDDKGDCHGKKKKKKHNKKSKKHHRKSKKSHKKSRRSRKSSCTSSSDSSSCTSSSSTDSSSSSSSSTNSSSSACPVNPYIRRPSSKTTASKNASAKNTV